MSNQVQDVIESAFEKRADITPTNTDPDVRKAVEETLNHVDSGKLRVAEKQGNDWITNEWIKKAVLLSFRMNENEIIDAGVT
ncbi:MAG: 2,3,4,5-tetrahydropyridine-2,6-dicarboxylate N-succinyltransferase, partial [Gammaproteobacteria bacterium]|nr:2,3,4,5-tetrahydropyridine-2,6-dicarboxylate N-succinyltransferase [Gammaproteobacteria bacterium]